MREKLPRELRDVIYEHIIESKQLTIDGPKTMKFMATDGDHKGNLDLYSCDCHCDSCRLFFETAIAREHTQYIVELSRRLGLTSISNASLASVPSRRDRQVGFPRHIADSNRLAEDVLVELAET